MSDDSATYLRAVARISDAIERASATGRRNMNAMSLATVDPSGAPSIRHVLLKSIDPAGLRFFTDARSEKARNLASDIRASVCFYWEPIEEQARVDGAGQVMITASAQSQPLDSLETLRRAAAHAESTLPDPAPCPEDWIGFRLVPRRIEHWKGSRDRIHTRTVCWLEKGEWQEALLQP